MILKNARVPTKMLLVSLQNAGVIVTREGHTQVKGRKRDINTGNVDPCQIEIILDKKETAGCMAQEKSFLSMV